jgi:hypothetical protein
MIAYEQALKGTGDECEAACLSSFPLTRSCLRRR